MGKIVFEKQGKNYIAEVKVSDMGFIHMERNNNGSGKFYVEQSHVKGGKYAPTNTKEDDKMSNNVNIDFVVTDEIYPVYLRLVSENEVVSAEGSKSVVQIGVPSNWVCIKVNSGEYGEALYFPFKKSDNKLIPIGFEYEVSSSRYGFSTDAMVVYQGMKMWASEEENVTYDLDNEDAMEELLGLLEAVGCPYEFADREEWLYTSIDLQEEFYNELDICEVFEYGQSY